MRPMTETTAVDLTNIKLTSLLDVYVNLPTYTKVRVKVSLRGETYETEGLVRDIPGRENRRLTSTISGTEWFIGTGWCPDGYEPLDLLELTILEEKAS